MASASFARKISKANRINAIVEAVSHADLSGYEALDDLAQLCSRARVDGIFVDPEGVILTGDNFNGIAAVYVVLTYFEMETPDTLEGRFEGHFEGARPVIDKITVDTSPLYE